MIPRVAILLAGFKGQKYLYEQVFSLLNQKGVIVDIFIRVDGELLAFNNMVIELASDYKNIHYIKGDVISSSGMNFYKLILGMKDTTFDYYSLCDQDDIWEESKLLRAHQCLENTSASGYSSGFTTFTSTGFKKRFYNGEQTKFDHFFQSSGPGCTFVFDNKGFNYLRNYLNQENKLLEVLAHDWLIYFIFRINNLGWYIDTQSHLLYRQHDSNVAGVNRGLNAKLKRVKILFNGWYISDLYSNDRNLYAVEFYQKNNLSHQYHS
ncbi:glycosyltransferase family 2 protein [Gammaproteobacteria bacterium]|nr:glycosyltransferase family 2 protein [Gammaproteobacteria bacterium]